MISVLYRLRSGSILPLILLGLHSQVSAHDAATGWKYPWACCSNMDCQQVQSSAVIEKPQGYVIQSTGESGRLPRQAHKGLARRRIPLVRTPGGLDAGQTICLFVPPRDS